MQCYLGTRSKSKQDSCPNLFFRIERNGQFQDLKINRIREGESVRLLGIWLDTDLSFKDFHSKIYKKLSFAAYALNRVKHFLDFDTLRILYYAFFHSHLEFSSTFLISSSMTLFSKIETLQKKVIRMLMGLPRYSHTAEAFWVLEILPFKTLCIFNCLKFMLQFRTRQLTSAFNNDFSTIREMNNRNLRNTYDF